jgi:hypothetical protein
MEIEKKFTCPLFILVERSRGNRIITVEPINIFVASASELKDEHQETIQVVHELRKVFTTLNLEAVEWETDIPSGSYDKRRIQDEINSLIEKCYIVMVLFYSKIGSFTLEEYRLAIAKGKKVFLYFKAGFSPKNIEESKHYADLIAFKEEIIADNKTLFMEYDDIKDFHYKIYKMVAFIKAVSPSVRLTTRQASEPVVLASIV